MAEHLSSLGDTLNPLVSDQAKSIGNLNDMREEMSKSETEYLTKQNEEIQSITNERTEIVKISKKSSVTLDVENLVKTVNTFSVEVVENVTSLKNSVDEYATTNVTRVKNLMTKN